MKTSHICLACKNLINNAEYKLFLPATIDKLSEFDDLKVISCSNCGFSFPTKIISEKDLSDYYSNSYSGKAKKVGKSIREIKIGKTPIDIRSLSQIELIRKFINLDSNSNVLEIGPGLGHFFRTLKFLGYSTNNYAIEPQIDAHNSLDLLNVKIEKDTLNSTIISQLAENKYDLIVMSHSLEHFNAADISTILNGIYNALSEGGYFLCEVPNANLDKYPDAGDLVVPHLAFFSIESIKHFFKEVGFKIKFINTCGNNQLDKFTREYLNDNAKKGYYNFETSDDGKMKINIYTRKYFEIKNKRRNRRLFLIKILEKIPLFDSFRNLVRKLKSHDIYDILNDSNFIYSEDREFIRVIAKK